MNKPFFNIQALATKLESPHREHVEAYLRNDDIDWDQFLTSFYNTYFDPQGKGSSMRQLTAIRQREGQTISEYQVYFKKLIAQSGIDPTTEYVARVFYDSLLPQIVKYCEPFPTGCNLADVINIAAKGYDKLESVNSAFERRKRPKAHSDPLDHEYTQKKVKVATMTKSDSNKPSCKPKIPGQPYGTPEGYLDLVNGALSEKIVEYRRKNGWCVRCGKDDHTKEACPPNRASVNAKWRRNLKADGSKPRTDYKKRGGNKIRMIGALR